MSLIQKRIFQGVKNKKKIILILNFTLSDQGVHKIATKKTCGMVFSIFNVKGYLRYKTTASQNVPSTVQIKNFFDFIEKLCSVLKMFKLLYF